MARFNWPGRFAALPATYYDDPTVIAVGPDAELWYVRALAWCGAHPETDGVIPPRGRRQPPRHHRRNGLRGRLHQSRPYRQNGDSVSVTSWVKWNGKWRDIQARAAARARN